MSAFDTYRQMRDSTLQNNRLAEQDLLREQDRNALRMAGTQYATGDATGARNALLSNGMIDEGLQLGRYDQQAARQSTLDEQAKRDRHFATLVAGAQGLRRLPAEQRWQAYQSRVLPILQQDGVDQSVISMITPDSLNDMDLDSLITAAGGEVEQPRYLQGQRGALDRIDPYTGDLINVRQAAREDAPNGYRWTADGALEPIQGGPADPRTAGALAASRRAPKAGRSGGRSSSGSARSSSPAAAPAGRPWERSW